MNHKTKKTIFGRFALSLIATAFVLPAKAAQVIVNDLVVQGSECIGLDCPNAPSFSFDTLRLQENNLRIHFDDTSSSASFPQNDWRIRINDTSNGGASYFAVEDSTANRTPFTITAGAPNNSLFVSSAGRLGLGTATPVVELHVVDGDTPTVRLEQDGSSGFTPQTWDVASNETNFFVRDATNGSTLPFRIQPGAPTSALHIRSDGKIGMGTASPADRLHVNHAGPARLRLTNSTATIDASNDQDWILNSNGTMRISAGSDAPEFELNAGGGQTLAGDLAGLEINRTDGGGAVDAIGVNRNGPARLRLSNTSASNTATTDQNWTLNSNGTFRLSAGTDAAELTLDAAGNMTVAGSITVNGTALNVPDYVFASDYQLLTLSDVEAHIATQGHLPGVPSAKEVAEKGLDMTQMQMTLLRKIEELTLYTLSQQKIIEKQQAAIDSLLAKNH